VEYAAALWAGVFAVFHIIWAAGWYPLLDAEGARAGMGAVWWKWAYDVVVAVMCVIAVPIVLARVMPWGRQLPPRLVRSLLFVGTSLLLLRTTAALVQTGYLIAAGRFQLLGVWEWWFFAGTILFTASALRVIRAARQPQLA